MYSDLENVQQNKLTQKGPENGNYAELNSNQTAISPPSLQLKCDDCAAEEDEMQAKFAPTQLKAMQMLEEEEEEAASLKKNPSQFKISQFQPMEEEEEEPASLKKNPSQFKISQFQPMEEEEEEPASLKKDPSQFKLNSSASPIQRAAEEESGIKEQMSQALGHDFSDVNIHTDSKAATNVGALAYTQGKDVHFAPGQFNPDTTQGKELIGHEFKHKEQQDNNRVQATTEVNGMPVNDDKGLEKEADDAGKIAAQTKLKEK